MNLLNIMRALADPTRLRIAFLVLRLELSVGELVQILDQSQPRVSRHIRILDEAGLLERRKEGSWVFLRPAAILTDSPVASLLAEADVSQGKAFQRDVLRLDEVRSARTDMAAAYFAAHADEWDSLRSLHIADSEVEARLAHILHSANSNGGRRPSLGPQNNEAAHNERGGHHPRIEQVFFNELAKQQSQNHGGKESNENIQHKTLSFRLVRKGFDGGVDFFPVHQNDGKNSAGLNGDVKDFGLGVVKTKQGPRQNEVAC